MLSFVPTPIGNLSDISLRTLQAFEKSDVVLCEDTRVTKKLIMLLGKIPIVQQNFLNLSVNDKRFISFHSHNQQEFLDNLTPDFFGQNVVFCTDAGMPSISDPGSLLLQYVREHNVEYEVLLGGSAFSHAFVHSGLEGSFAFFGFLPHKQQDRQTQLKKMLCYHKDLHLIVYESPKRLRDSLQDIDLIFPCARLFVYKELTKMYQSEIIGSVKHIIESLPMHIRGEYCIIIERQSHTEDMYFVENVLHLRQEDILTLDVSPKQKAKLLAQISNKNTKEWYAWILQNT